MTQPNNAGGDYSEWNEKKYQSRIMARRLFVAGLRERAARMYTCSDYIVTRVSPATGEIKTDTTMLCRDRLCPICSWRLSRRRFAEMMAVFSAIRSEIMDNRYTVKLLTLTVKNMPLAELPAALAAFSQAWHNMSRREYFKTACMGWARSLEITYNSDAETYHPHLHVLLIWRQGADDTDIAGINLRSEWRSAAKLDYDPVIDIRDAYGNGKSSDVISSALEAFKYAIKPDSIKRVPNADLAEFAAAIKNVRFVGYGKMIKNARRALGFKQDDLAQIDDADFAAPDTLILAVMRWNGTEYTDETLLSEPWAISAARLQRELDGINENTGGQ